MFTYIPMYLRILDEVPIPPIAVPSEHRYLLLDPFRSRKGGPSLCDQVGQNLLTHRWKFLTPFSKHQSIVIISKTIVQRATTNVIVYSQSGLKDGIAQNRPLSDPKPARRDSGWMEPYTTSWWLPQIGSSYKLWTLASRIDKKTITYLRETTIVLCRANPA